MTTGLSPETKRSRVAKLARCWGVGVAAHAACDGHHAPLDFLTAWIYDRPPVSLVLGPRGGGKSFLASFATHVDSIRHDFHGTKVLGGSLAQSQQIYNALRDFDRSRPGSGVFSNFTKTAATYSTGSEVSILAASSTSIRGPHIPTLRLDEVDEIDPEIREGAMGMCMARRGVPASVSMTSTWHNVGGPMEALIERARGGDFPHFAFCAFEVLERCPDERSGPALENCPACPLLKWCHATKDGVPKAKRSSGHYAIESLIQKVRTVSLRTFEADYLCLGPKADGVWFKNFHRSTHVGDDAECDPALPVHLSIDSGVFTGAVWFQVKEVGPNVHEVHVFADYLAEGSTAEANARAILAVGGKWCNGRKDVISTDPAGGSRTAIGPTVIGEYCRAGLCDERYLRRWPIGSVADSLALLESFVEPASGSPLIRIHPRCENLIRALENYRRAKRGGQWQDYPEDPLHPFEDLVDALRGGLRERFPEGRAPEPKRTRVNFRKVF